MAKVPQYITIADKEAAFIRIEINDLDNLIAVLTKFDSENTFFRGQADGAWKLFSASQRDWITKDLIGVYGQFESYLSKLLAFIRVVEKARLQANCKIVTDISIFSVLQHFGCPTPFLDFSSKWINALYFATENDIPFGNNPTNSYISIYMITEGGTPVTPFNDLCPFDKMLAATAAKLSEIRESQGSIAGTDFYDFLNFESWKGYKLLLMKEVDEWYMKIANKRSELQDGLFVYSKSDVNSIDFYFNGAAEQLKEGVYLFPALPKITCIDIHKNLRSSIRDYLKLKGVSKNTLGLDGDDWGKVAYDKFLSNP